MNDAVRALHRPFDRGRVQNVAVKQLEIVTFFQPLRALGVTHDGGERMTGRGRLLDDFLANETGRSRHDNHRDATCIIPLTWSSPRIPPVRQSRSSAP